MCLCCSTTLFIKTKWIWPTGRIMLILALNWKFWLKISHKASLLVFSSGKWQCFFLLFGFSGPGSFWPWLSDPFLLTQNQSPLQQTSGPSLVAWCPRSQIWLGMVKGGVKVFPPSCLTNPLGCLLSDQRNIKNQMKLQVKWSYFWTDCGTFNPLDYIILSVLSILSLNQSGHKSP